MTQTASTETLSGGPPELRQSRAWPIGFAIAALLIFVFYQWVLPELDTSTRTFFRSWLPLSAVNEALVFVIMALGLNVVVGYAGLLDLGYVAFWAIGGYTAGWIMSAFFFQVDFHLLSPAPPGEPGIRLTSGSCSSSRASSAPSGA